jgi:hypothetical protein
MTELAHPTAVPASTEPPCPKAERRRRNRPEFIRLGIALLGGILVLNSYLAKVLFGAHVDPVARDLSAFIGALMLSLPIFWEAACDLIQGKVHMN